MRPRLPRRPPAQPGAQNDGLLVPANAGRTGRCGVAIRTDYRDILELLRWLSGTADPQLDQSGRWYVAMRLFYPTFAEMPQACWPQATDFLAQFLAAGRREQARPGPPLMDWQQDAPLIAAGISRAAGQDVRTLPYLHWWSLSLIHNSYPTRLSLVSRMPSSA